MRINNWKLILAMALPMVISYGTQTIAGTLNLMMVGYLGAVAIASFYAPESPEVSCMADPLLPQLVVVDRDSSFLMK